MKTDESRIPLPVKHEHDHALPTVIHHPEEEQPLLAQWLHRAMENPTTFWGIIGGVIVVTLGLSLVSSGLTLGGKATTDGAWAKLDTAKTPGDRVEIAKGFPNTPAERWALLQAASEYYMQGFNDLPANRDAALPNLKKALDLFQKVADAAPADTSPARVASLGLARTLEARNEIDKALKQYEKVAQTKAWAGTDEAHEAERLATLLKSPESVAFYKDLYAYKAPEAILPPGGVGSLPISLPSDHPPLNGPTTPTTTSPFTIPLTAPLTFPSGSGGAADPNVRDLPPPPPTPASKGETSKPSVTAPGLPADVFAPPASPK